MPGYTNISNALVAVGAKPFATTIQALRDNPIAIAEGAPGAPKVVGEALNLLQPFVDTLGTTWGQWTNLDRAEWVEINGHLLGGSSSTHIQLRLSSDNGSTWSAASTVTAVVSASGSRSMFRGLINVKTGAYRFYTSGAGGYKEGTLALTGRPNAIGIRSDATGAEIKADLQIIKGVSP